MCAKMYKRLEATFNQTEDSHLVKTRKSVLLEGEEWGYLRPILVYPKASLSEVKAGDPAMAYPWKVSETVKGPNHRDGFVICSDC